MLRLMQRNHLHVFGDGTATTGIFNVMDLPVDPPGPSPLTLPDAVTASYPPGVTASLSANRKKVTLHFDVAPAGDIETPVALDFYFFGE